MTTLAALPSRITPGKERPAWVTTATFRASAPRSEPSRSRSTGTYFLPAGTSALGTPTSTRSLSKKDFNDSVRTCSRPSIRVRYWNGACAQLLPDWKADMTVAQLGSVATIRMGQSPPGNTCFPTPVGEPLLNGPTEFGPSHPVPRQWTTAPARSADVGDLLICVRGSTTGRMNRADQ